ncbi:MAG: EAL domain-containing protein [Sphingomonadales bacterium]|nr:EAL domain-containing protein [Sphingomonadales bacterium]
MTSFRQLALKIPAVGPDDAGELAYERFNREPDCPLLPVIDSEQRPIGLIERNAFLMKFASQYGRAVFASRPISLLMAPSPLLVDIDENPGDFAEHALGGHSDALVRGFVITEGDCYFGVGAILDLLKSVIVERTATAARTASLAERLSASNLALERQRRLAEAVIEHIPSHLAVRSEPDGRLLLVNSSGARLLGAPPEALVGRRLGEISPPHVARQLRRAERALCTPDPAPPRDLVFHPGRGKAPRTLRTAMIPIDMPPAEQVSLFVADDVTDVRQAHSRIAELAHFDMLTGLPNRVQLHDHLDRALAAARHCPGEKVALLAIDLDRFKQINDAFGHAMGDRALEEIARRIRASIRAEDMPARLGGDEFAVVVSGPDAAAAAELVAARLTDHLHQPCCLGDKIAVPGASIGLAIYPDDAADAVELMRHADFALYQVKANGKGSHRRFDASMRDGLALRATMESDLRGALENGELDLHLQPLLDIGSGRIQGFECLLRWQHPIHGTVPPATFIPLAEEIGLICQLGEWVVHRACAILARLPEPMFVAVNISAIQFRLPGLVACVARALAQSGVAHDRLELEITESVLISDETQVIQCVRQLRDLGVRIALDDFGTGFSSFSYLQRFAFDKIKIDRSFISGLPTNPASRAIVSALTVMGRQLGAVVTAEGVETEVQLDCLRELGCTEAQGYLIGRPAGDISDYLAAGIRAAKVA